MGEHIIRQQHQNEKIILERINNVLENPEPHTNIDELRQSRLETQRSIGRLSVIIGLPQESVEASLLVPPTHEPLDAPQAPSLIAQSIDNHPKLFEY